MAEVPAEVPEDVRPQVLETADAWLSVGLTSGLEDPRPARRLRPRIGADAVTRVALSDHAAGFLAGALPCVGVASSRPSGAPRA
jgi:hypothetical protein